MIQVCSQCGTRWNVRDRQRVWCPRCNGTLLAPSGPAAQPEWAPRPGSMPAVPPRSGASLPAGYRWVAVRPGAPPPPRVRRRPLGPTPRYPVIPRWGLTEYFESPGEAQVVRAGPSVAAVRATLLATMAVLGAAAFIHLLRYVLLIINRTVLLNRWVAGVATWVGVAASVIAVFMVVASAVVLTNWLIARRAAAFAHHQRPEPRSTWALRAGCLIPLVNLAWAPVFVVELAEIEDRLNGLRRPIVAWWMVWLASTALSGFSIATSFTTDAQGIADNTVTTIVAYLFGLAAVLLALRVLLGFERQPVERPYKRWVMVAVETDEPKDTDPACAVEPEGENPAA
ncbi:DUF4328 domain-containing protein [Mycobacterium sp. Y57]|uniref:DUF4328 domain-containing protein n=1 Tax=Mycolicibacterium xanthum TaxID=2796469 RepID=UPI001C841FE6|nr:DUF4328 domain-containing protein [Mycolicibacterium xanthum]MBX7430997.1 DUF4328 domain-containing protein [Mycolicibacterium xanthum]